MDIKAFYSQKRVPRFESAIVYAFAEEYNLMNLEKDTYANADFNSFLQSILSQLPNGENFIKMKCILQTMISFGGKVENDVGYDLALIDYQNMNKNHIQDINSHLNEDYFDDKVAHNICFSLLNIYYEKPGIFFTILPFFEKILKVIRPERANKITGSECLLFYTNPDIDIFQQLEINPMMIVPFFQYPVIYSNLEFCKVIQYKFTEEYEYPKTFPECDIEMAFLNTTIKSNHHFLDTVSDCFVKFINMSDDYTIIPDTINKYPRLLPLLIIAHQPILYKDLTKSLTLFKHEFIQSLSSEIVHRFQNDQEIIDLISFMTPDEIMPNDLLVHSLPYLLQFTLSNPQLLNYSKMRFYLINDEDSQRDFDFIRSYQIIRMFLSFFQKPINALEQNIQKMQNQISLITNKATQSFILFDLFSLIFIQKDGKYICHQYVAEKLVQLLLHFTDAIYIRRAIAIFNSRKNKPKKKDPPNLQIYFENNNVNNIYPAIEEKNWNLANQLTEFNPYLRKLFVRAYAISLIMSNHQPPQNIEKDYKHALFEYSLSTFNQEILKNDFLHYLSFQEFVEDRLKYKSVRDLLFCIPNNEKYKDAIKNAAKIGDKIAESIADESIKNYVKSFSVSKNLLSFLDNIDLYYICSSLNPFAKNMSVQQMFTFDLVKALAGPFNKGEFIKAKELSRRFKINLFQFVIKNLPSFNITEKYLSKSIHKYFLESVFLALQNEFFNFLNQQTNISMPIQKYVNQKLGKQEHDDKSSLSKIIDIINHRKFDEIEDYLYNVDHYELYNYLIQTIQPTQYSDELIKLLDVVQYTAPDSDKEKIKAIHVINAIHHTTTETNPTQIISELMKKDMFQLAIDYIKVEIPINSWGPPIIHLFSMCLKNPSRIDSILVEFSSRFDLIKSRFFHIHGIIPHLLKYCPPDKLNEVHALSLLPEEVMSDSNVFDFNTVAESFARQPKSILKLTPNMNLIFTDDNLLAIIEKVEPSIYFNKVFFVIYGLFKDKKRIVDIWTNKIFESIKKISVNSVTQEDECVRYLNSQEQIISIFPESDISVKKISCVIEFVNYHPFLYKNLIYSFTNFGESSFPPIFVDYLQKIDHFDLAQKVSNIFDVDISAFAIQRLYTLLLTRDLEGALNIMNSSNYKIEIDRTDPKGTYYDRSYFKLYPLTKMPIFDPQVFVSIRNFNLSLHNSNIPSLFVYQLIKVTKKIVLDEEKSKIIPTFFRKSFSIKPCISLLVSHKYLNIAYQILMHLRNENEEELSQIFISYFYKSALCSDYIQKTEQFLILQDPALIVTKPLWDNLVSFFEKHDMYNSLYKVYIIRNQPEEAADVKIKLFDEENSLPHKIALIGHAIYCLTNAIHYRNNPKLTKDPKFIPNPSKELDDIIKQKLLLEFMLKICEFCSDKQVPFIIDYNLLNDQTDHVKLAVLLFLNGESQLLSVLTAYISKSIDYVAKMAAKELAIKDFKEICKSIEIVINSNKKIASRFLKMLLDQMTFQSNYGLIIALILKFCKDPEMQFNKMIEYDFLLEAYSLIVNLKDKSLIPLAAHRAAQLGQTDLLINFLNLLKK